MPARKALPEPPKDSNDPPPPLPNRPARPGLRQPPLPPPDSLVSSEVYSEPTLDEEYEEPGSPLTPQRPPPIVPSGAPTEVYDELTCVVTDEKDEPDDMPSAYYDEFDVQTQPVYEIDNTDTALEYEDMENQPPLPSRPPASSTQRTLPQPPDMNTIPQIKGMKFVKEKEQSPALPNRPTPPKKIPSNIGSAVVGVPGLKQTDLINVLQNLKRVDDGSKDTQKSKAAKNYDMDDNVTTTMNKFKQKEAKAKAEEDLDRSRRTSSITSPTSSSKPAFPQRPGQMEQPPQPPPSNSIPKFSTPNSTSTRESFNDLPPPPEPFFEEQIYDDACSEEKHELDPFPWFHGLLKRDHGRDRINRIGKDGTFLVRKSEKGGETQPYTMMVLFDGHIYNLKIRITNTRYALGEEKKDEITFKDLQELVTYHQKNDVILIKGDIQSRTLLTEIPTRV